jgi:Holliday junction resolvase RusA-like endonuclease
VSEPLLQFTVAGSPVPQGSKRVAEGRNGQAYVYEASSKRLKPWREAITLMARSQWKNRGQIRGPIFVELMFHVKHPTRGQRRTWHVAQPDIDKLTRAVLDSLTDAKVWFDDSQVCALSVTKTYRDEPGVHIIVHDLPA